MRTVDEIKAEVRRLNEDRADFFGVRRQELIARLAFEEAREFLSDDAVEKDWGTVSKRDRETILTEMRDYVAFAWNKANGCRGLSAQRSLDHYWGWLFLLGGEDAEWARRLEASDYCYYGKPQLRAICERFGWTWKELDSGHWKNSEMSDGVPAEAVPEVP